MILTPTESKITLSKHNLPDQLSKAAEPATINQVDLDSKNNYILQVQKRLRTLKKRQIKIEKYELIQDKSTLNQDQILAIKKKPEVDSLVKELDEILSAFLKTEKSDAKILKEEKLTFEKEVRAEFRNKEFNLKKANQEKIVQILRLYYILNNILPNATPNSVVSEGTLNVLFHFKAVLLGGDFKDSVAFASSTAKLLESYLSGSEQEFFNCNSDSKSFKELKEAVEFINSPPPPPVFQVSELINDELNHNDSSLTELEKSENSDKNAPQNESSDENTSIALQNPETNGNIYQQNNDIQLPIFNEHAVDIIPSHQRIIPSVFERKFPSQISFFNPSEVIDKTIAIHEKNASPESGHQAPTQQVNHHDGHVESERNDNTLEDVQGQEEQFSDLQNSNEKVTSPNSKSKAGHNNKEFGEGQHKPKRNWNKNRKRVSNVSKDVDSESYKPPVVVIVKKNQATSGNDQPVNSQQQQFKPKTQKKYNQVNQHVSGSSQQISKN
ncbi:hypothetical protein HK099_000347 [Clydaea vesicula]|uniref:Uncharacterized protein n=1 Tax=Clydaea vesicula TaxID=447962 RepID=A0AAD5XVJ1_9FUNG|nr:hypothetical protein HK099_000347 [Clydaea vesicula]